jgi:hypothetical protein
MQNSAAVLSLPNQVCSRIQQTQTYSTIMPTTPFPENRGYGFVRITSSIVLTATARSHEARGRGDTKIRGYSYGPRLSDIRLDRATMTINYFPLTRISDSIFNNTSEKKPDRYTFSCSTVLKLLSRKVVDVLYLVVQTLCHAPQAQVQSTTPTPAPLPSRSALLGGCLLVISLFMRIYSIKLIIAENEDSIGHIHPCTLRGVCPNK